MAFPTKEWRKGLKMILKPLPYSFVREHVTLSWRDMLWGYEHQLIGWPGVIGLAKERVMFGSDNQSEIVLSNLDKSQTQEIGDLLRALAGGEPESAGRDAARKWLFLLLAMLFKNRGFVSDPLSEVESIYADFDYPVEIESFVRYMPAADNYDPSRHAAEENEARLFSNWGRYLSEAALEFSGGDR